MSDDTSLGIKRNSLNRMNGPISVTDLFTIGIGPSSSHTVGPMRAAHQFIDRLGPDLTRCTSISIELYGSLALTGKGHCTDTAILLGISGWLPETVDPGSVPLIADLIRSRGEIALGGRHTVRFDEREQLIFRKGQFLPLHSNGMKFSAFCGSSPLLCESYYSIGGGAIVSDREVREFSNAAKKNSDVEPYPFQSGRELLEIGLRTGLSISEIVAANELSQREESETMRFLDRVRKEMMDCVDRGCRTSGTLPGGLNVSRRAPAIYARLKEKNPRTPRPCEILEWVSLFALAVNEENAAGGRVVTAPTNGAAGVIACGAEIL